MEAPFWHITSEEGAHVTQMRLSDPALAEAKIWLCASRRYVGSSKLPSPSNIARSMLKNCALVALASKRASASRKHCKGTCRFFDFDKLVTLVVLRLHVALSVLVVHCCGKTVHCFSVGMSHVFQANLLFPMPRQEP